MTLTTNNQTPLTNKIFNSENIQKFSAELNTMSPIDLAHLIENKPWKEELLIFNALSHDKAINTFEYIPFKIQQKILKTLPLQAIASLLNSIAPDDRTALFQRLPEILVNQLIQSLSPEEREVSIKLLAYPEDSVGRLMTTDFIAIKMDWTVKQVLDYIRAKGHDSETVNVIYAVDDNGILIDDFRIRQFLFAPFDAKVKDLADSKFVSLNVYDTPENAINVFRKYGRFALPVVDNRGFLLGIVTFDDIMTLSVKEDTEDFQRIGSVETFDESYTSLSFLELLRKRVGWLILLFLGEMLTASAMGYFQDEIAKAVVLALFLPLIISSGGNAGSQSTTLIIRAMALGEVTLKDWWKTMRREIFAGACLGLALGSVGFIRIVVWSLLFTHIYGLHWPLIALTIFLALIGVVLWGTLAGAMLPFILRRCGFDPAVASASLVATVVDVTGLIIYFTIALFVLRGTLL